jgi:hypothetical protein
MHCSELDWLDVGRLIGFHGVLAKHSWISSFEGLSNASCTSKWWSLPNLHRSITVAIVAVHVNVLSWVWSEVQFHFNVYMAVIGAHIVAGILYVGC